MDEQTRMCNTCGVEKSLNFFPYMGKFKGDKRHRPKCRECGRIASYPNNKKKYDQNREAEIAGAGERKKKYREQNRKYVNEIRENTPCADCGHYYPFFVMEFDHAYGDKVDNVYKMAGSPVSMTKLKMEINKCDIICANCHFQREHLRRVWNKLSFQEIFRGLN